MPENTSTALVPRLRSALSVARVEAIRPATVPAEFRLDRALGGYVLGGLAGMSLWREHRVLGFLSGSRAGMSASTILSGSATPAEKRRAWINIGSSAAEVTLGKAWHAHPTLGWIAGGLVVEEAVKRMKLGG